MAVDKTQSADSMSTTSYYLPSLKQYLSAWNVTETAGSTAVVKIRDQLEQPSAMTVTEITGSNSTVGLHFFACVAVTAHGESIIGGTSGTNWVEFTAVGSKKYSFAAVPVWPINRDGRHTKIDSAIVGRRIYATKAAAPATQVNPTNAQWFRFVDDFATTVAAGMNAMFLPLTNGSLTVASTTGFAASGNVLITTVNGTKQVVAYTSVDATHFLGCTGGQGLLTTGDAVTQPYIGDNTSTTWSAGSDLADASFVNTRPAIKDLSGKRLIEVKLAAGQSVGDHYSNPLACNNGGGFGVEVTSGTVDWSIQGA